MKTNVIYTGFDGEYRHIVDSLFRDYGWKPVSILGRPDTREWAGTYPNCLFHEYMKLRTAQFDYSMIKEVPIDAKMIEGMSKCQSYCLNSMVHEDTTGWNFSFNERLRFYYDLLKFFNSVIKHTDANLFIASSWPHMVEDYVFYQVCQYHNIKILFIDVVPLFNCNGNKYNFISVSLEDPSRVFNKIYNSDKTYKIGGDVKQYFNSVRSKKGMTPPYITEFYSNSLTQGWNIGFKKQWMRECWRLVKLLFTGRFFEKYDVVDWKDNRHPHDSIKSKMNYLQFILFKERIRRDDKKLKKIYSAYVAKPDLNKKYIYYAAAVQPEAGIWSTYQDQLLALDILSACIPDDWVIYYKEHPCTFCAGSRSSLVRSEHYYKKVSMHKNVIIIPSDEDTFMIIDHSQAVATPGGTVGWEAVVRGKPALTFGHIWYQGCKSIFKIVTYQDCVDAMEKIKNGYTPDQSDVERFAAVVEQVSGKNIINGNWLADQIKACPDPKYQMERIAKLFYEAYERNYAEFDDVFKCSDNLSEENMRNEMA